MRTLAVVTSLLAGTASADRVAITLVERLATASGVFTGVARSKSKTEVSFAVQERLKGTGGPSEVLPAILPPGKPIPLGRQLLVVVSGDEHLAIFDGSSLEARHAKAVLALLGPAAQLAPFKLATCPMAEVRFLLHEVFDSPRVPQTLRVDAMRQLLVRAKPDWETEILPLAPELVLPALVGPLVEYFQRFPRSQFSSAHRWTVFEQLKSREAAPFLLAELDALRVDDEVNLVRYALTALEASDLHAAGCYLAGVQAQGGLWPSREELNREFDAERAPAAIDPGACPPPFLPEAKVAALVARYDKAGAAERLSILRQLTLFGEGTVARTDWLRRVAATEAEPARVEQALRAAGRVGSRATWADPAQLAAFFDELAGWFGHERGAQPDAAAASAARLLARPAGALLVAAWLDRPGPRAGPYGTRWDFVAAVSAELRFSLVKPIAAALLDRAVAVEGPLPNALGGCLRQIERETASVKPRVLSLLEKADPPSRVRALQIARFLPIDGALLRAAAGDLKRPEPSVRAAAINALDGMLGFSEDYSQGTPLFPTLLDALTDPAPEVRKAASGLVVQLAVKGMFAQYVKKTPELAQLLPALLDRIDRAKAVDRPMLVDVLRAFPDDSLTAGQRQTRERYRADSGLK